METPLDSPLDASSVPSTSLEDKVDNKIDNKIEDNKEIIFKIGDKKLSITFAELMNSYAKITVNLGKQDQEVSCFSKHFATFIEDFSIFEIELKENFYPLEFMNIYFELLKEKNNTVINDKKEIISISDKMYSIFSSIMDSKEKREKFAVFLERVSDEYVSILFSFFNAKLIMSNDQRILDLIDNLMDDLTDSDDDEKNID